MWLSCFLKAFFFFFLTVHINHVENSGMSLNIHHLKVV